MKQKGYKDNKNTPHRLWCVLLCHEESLNTLERTNAVCIYSEVPPSKEKPSITSDRSSSDKGRIEPKLFTIV